MDKPKLEDVLHHYPEFTGIHPACLAVPGASDEDFTALVENVRRHGLARELCSTHDGMLVDGRHRLLACYITGVEIRVKRLPKSCSEDDVWDWVETHNITQRHLKVGQKAMWAQARFAREQEKAKERQRASGGSNTYQQNNSNRPVPATLPEPTRGEAREKAAASVGIGAKSIDKARTIIDHRPDLAEQVRQGKIDLEPAYKEARKAQQQKEQQPIERPLFPLPVEQKATVRVVTHQGESVELDAPKTVRFNQTNDSIDWAGWSWNPVTGCEHGCEFCYAREIALKADMKPYYPFGFAPAFHEYRLAAPKNTAKPDASADPRKGRVFVCSMADLFGKWVPDEWIKKVFAACLDSSQWEYLFLTKYPTRYAKLPKLIKAWYGASVIRQADVQRIEKAMKSFDVSADSCKWVSLEPMLEPIRFDDLRWCNLLVIGSQTSTTQPGGFVPEFAPEFDWVVDVVNQCREQGVPYYLKANLGNEKPGMKLPKSVPKRSG